MKKLLIAAAFAVALSACATTPDTRLAAGKADALAWTTLDAAAVGLREMAISGKIRGDDATKARAMLDKATAALVAADGLYQSGQTATAEQSVATAAGLIAQILVLTSHPKGT
jgi:hypothetical protein